MEQYLRPQDNNQEVRTSLDELDKELLSDHISQQSKFEASEIDLELFNRLLKCGVMRANPMIKTYHDRKIVQLDTRNSEIFVNGIAFSNYLMVLKTQVKTVNQDFEIDEVILKSLKDNLNPQSRLYNWNNLCSELEKIGIIIENDNKGRYVAGDNEEIGKLFKRIERFVTRIAGPEMLLFDGFRKNEGVSGLGKPGQNGQRAQPSQKRTVKDGVDIMQMDINKEPSETESTLEFILNTLCRALTMKPKQAAALLTNNNQFLIHCVVKGVKSRFEPMINWYQEIYQYSRHLSMMLEIEVDNANAQGDQKLIKACHQNFDKVLQTISCGCYSNNFEVAQLCLKTLSCIAADFSNNLELAQLTMKWFQSKDQGIYTINYALKKHIELAEDFVTCVGNFTGGGEQMSWTYVNTLMSFYPETAEYFTTMNTIFPFLAMKYSEEMTSSNMLALIIEKCVRFSDQDPTNTNEVRNAALSLLTEVWLAFTSYIDDNESFLNSVQHVYKKNVRDKSATIRLVAIAHTFRLLDKFAQDKNVSAPALYKTLIFSLVESPQEQTVREMLLVNFTTLFEGFKSIPIGLLIEPFVKANQVSDMFSFQTFDFDFFTILAKHSKLTLQLSIMILDLMARIYLNDSCNASAASVPFVMICSRYQDDPACQEFVLKFITICLNQYLQLSMPDPAESPTPKNGVSPLTTKPKLLALPAPDGTGMPPAYGRSRDFRISSSKKSVTKSQLEYRAHRQEQDLENKLKRNLIIGMLVKLQNLKQSQINDALKEMTLGAQRQYRDQKRGVLSNGLLTLLKYYGEPEDIFNKYMNKIKNAEKKEKRVASNEQNQQLVLMAEASMKSKNLTKSIKGTTGKSPGDGALVPVVSNKELNLRAQQTLEKIKEKKRKQEEDQLALQVSEQHKETIKQKHLNDQLSKRRVLMGVAGNVGGQKQELGALIVKEQTAKQLKMITAENYKLVDINEEEDRDIEMLSAFMKKYAKVWKFMFQRYANQTYSVKGKEGFDNLKMRIEQINQGEIHKMLKEHNTFPTLVSKDEIATLLRLINAQSTSENARDIAMLDYDQFLLFIPQLAFLCFSRPPVDLSHLPSVECLRALLARWEQATRDRGKNTALFDDPDASAFADRELLKALDKKVADDPNYPLPEGYRKVAEKIPSYSYGVPQFVKPLMKESTIVCVEVLDEIFHKAIGVHFLEPKVSFDVKYKVRPIIQKVGVKPEKAEALNYMKKLVRKAGEELADKDIEKRYKTAADRRREQLEVKPKLSLALKLQVTKQDLNKRHYYQDVAEVLEEFLQAAEKGLNHLPPRPSRIPGQLHNEAKELKAKRQKEEQDLKDQKEAKRRERHEQVKDLIKTSDYGGRGVPIGLFRVQEKQKEADQKRKLDQAAAKDFQAKTAEKLEHVEKLKEEKKAERQAQKEQEDAAQQEKQRMQAQERKEFLKNQMGKITEQFQQTYNKRDQILLKREEANKMHKENEKMLRDQIQSMIEETREDRELEKSESKTIANFMEGPEVAAVFSHYDKQLLYLYNFFASMDTKKDNTFDLDYLRSTLSLREYVRFGFQTKIVPQFVTPDDMVFVYKALVHEQKDIIQDKDQSKLSEADKKHNKSGMIDYSAFLKGLVRICILGQEKIGGVNKESLQAALDKQAEKNKSKVEEFQKAKGKVELQKVMKKEEMENLKKQFQEEQRNKQSILSKKHTKSKGSEGDANGMTLGRQQKMKQLELDEQMMNQEDEFFQKWLKQKQNLGDRRPTNTLARQNSQGSLASAPGLSSSMVVNKKKDATTAELEKVQKQIDMQKKMTKYKVETRQIRKGVDVTVISAETIESLIQFMNITENDTDWEINRRLNESMNQKRGGSVKKGGRESGLNNTIKETEPAAEDDEMERNSDLDRS